MAARKRMEQVKTAILSLLLDAYQRRDKVGLITFRDTAAHVALPPTGSVDLAARRLETLPAGGRTPLAEGLLEAARTMERERLKDPRRRPLLVVVTDGRATHGRDAVVRSLRVADKRRQRWSSGWLKDDQVERGWVRYQRTGRVRLHVWQEAGDRDSGIGTALEREVLRPRQIERCG